MARPGYGEPVDQTAFYATVSGLGFTLLGLWGVVADRHREWFADRRRAAMAYVIALHFMLPASMSLLSLVAPELPLVWRTVFTLMGLSGLVGAVLVWRGESGRRPTLSRVAVLLGVPVYAAVVAVALFPGLTGLTELTPLQVEAFLVCAILLLGLNASWFFSHEAPEPARAGGSTASAGADAPRA